jgi:hypothetical protein
MISSASQRGGRSTVERNRREDKVPDADVDGLEQQVARCGRVSNVRKARDRRTTPTPSRCREPAVPGPGVNAAGCHQKVHRPGDLGRIAAGVGAMGIGDGVQAAELGEVAPRRAVRDVRVLGHDPQAPLAPCPGHDRRSGTLDRLAGEPAELQRGTKAHSGSIDASAAPPKACPSARISRAVDDWPADDRSHESCCTHRLQVPLRAVAASAID